MRLRRHVFLCAKISLAETPRKMQRKELIFVLSSALLDDRLNFRLTLNSHTMLLRVAVSAVSRDDVNYPAERASRTNP
jgi:hypothetical protein